MPSSGKNKNSKKKQIKKQNENDEEILLEWLDEFVPEHFNKLIFLQEKLENDINYVRNALKYNNVEYPSLLDNKSSIFERNRGGSSFPSLVDNDAKELSKSFNVNPKIPDHKIMLGNI